MGKHELELASMHAGKFWRATKPVARETHKSLTGLQFALTRRARQPGRSSSSPSCVTERERESPSCSNSNAWLCVIEIDHCRQGSSRPLRIQICCPPYLLAHFVSTPSCYPTRVYVKLPTSLQPALLGKGAAPTFPALVCRPQISRINMAAWPTGAGDRAEQTDSQLNDRLEL